MAAQSKTYRLKFTGLRLGETGTIALREALAQALGVATERIESVRILRRSLDARQRTLCYEYSLAADICLTAEEFERISSDSRFSLYQEEPMPVGPRLSLKQRPVVVGCGPAGLFAALALAERGCPPLVIERGERISGRVAAVQAFWKHGELNPESNVVFGEGGAGTFSDGKLTARGSSPFKQRVLEELVACGADSDILFDTRAHVGTDRLRRVIPALVERLQQRGVEFRFGRRLDDIVIEQGRVRSVHIAGEMLETGLVVLAVGHSARDTVRMLAGRGMRIEPKGFAVGARIEHPQDLIDCAMRRDGSARSAYGPADYALKHQDTVSGRGVYSFCMCPGGLVIGCSSQPETLCVNGMSFSKRSGSRANAAIVVTVAPDDFNSNDALGGIAFQEHIERLAYAAGGIPYYAPAQCVADFVRGCASIDLPCEHITYTPGVTPADLASLLPVFIVDPLRRALAAFDKKIPGFIEQGILIGFETRTSSPVRMLRDPDTFQAAGIAGLVPVGEGAGYSGGIVSSAVDGLRAGWRVG
ncbi:MAG: FAD-binding protein [Deltaproteobacteria bacterium]|nr:FAD-binding protein [Deltaproteobacteria bacterium]